MVIAFKPSPGSAFNSLVNYRNIQCFCGSRKKAKKCCGRHRYIKEESAKKIDKWLKSMGLKILNNRECDQHE